MHLAGWEGRIAAFSRTGSRLLSADPSKMAMASQSPREASWRIMAREAISPPFFDFKRFCRNASCF